MCKICFSRLRSCTMLIVYSGDCAMEQVRWWQPLTPPLAAGRPERAWVKPTRATGNVQRQVTDLRSIYRFTAGIETPSVSRCLIWIINCPISSVCSHLVFFMRSRCPRWDWISVLQSKTCTWIIWGGSKAAPDSLTKSRRFVGCCVQGKILWT